MSRRRRERQQCRCVPCASGRAQGRLAGERLLAGASFHFELQANAVAF